jgi:hypothetical protein
MIMWILIMINRIYDFVMIFRAERLLEAATLAAVFAARVRTGFFPWFVDSGKNPRFGRGRVFVATSACRESVVCPAG